MSETHAPDDAYEVLRRHFTEEEQVKLTLLMGSSTPGTGSISAFAPSTRPKRRRRPDGTASSQDAAAVFDPLRPSLVRVAYRMLGSVADAEDVVQDAFLRWLDVDRDAVREPAAFLRRIVTRLCLDRLKSVRRERETYVGTWLPEPVVDSGEDELDDVTLPLLMALERLSPLERAAFLLHDVFGLDFDEVAATIGRDASRVPPARKPRACPCSCRPSALSSAEGTGLARSRKPSSPRPGTARWSACGRCSRLTSPSTPMAAARCRLRTAPVAGLDDVMRLFARFAPVFAASRSRLVRYGFINGLPGFVTIERGDILQTTALEIERRASSPSMSCVIPISSGTWLTPCIDADFGRNHEVAVGPLIPKFVSDGAANAGELRNPTTKAVPVRMDAVATGGRSFSSVNLPG